MFSIFLHKKNLHHLILLQTIVIGLARHGGMLSLLGLWVLPRTCIWHTGPLCRNSHLLNGHFYNKGLLYPLQSVFELVIIVMKRFAHPRTYMVNL